MRDEQSEEQGLTLHDGSSSLLPAPVFNGQAMAQALKAYRSLQAELDRAMPDQIIEISGREFRKKGYWRAVRMSFNLKVEFVREERTVAGAFDDGLENFGYSVVYRATAPNGSSAEGDGAAFAVEKASKQARKDGTEWSKRPQQATEHNIRSHAHTRAFNRAVSNLCGFGEVSAEEMPLDAGEPQQRQAAPAQRGNPVYRGEEPMDGELVDGPGDHDARQHPTQRQAQQPAQRQQAQRAQAPRQAAPGAARRSGSNQAGGGGVISEGQSKRLYAIAQSNGWGKNYKPALLEVWGVDDDRAILKSQYEEIVAWAENGPPE